MSLNPEEFTEFRRFLKSAAGIDLGDNKQYLVTTRIRRVLLEFGLESIGELTKRIQRATERELRQRVIDAMTTNETFWFRDIYPFDYLKSTLFPEIKKNNALATTRIWSAACSSGQEPYSISITADEFVRSARGVSAFNLELVATDLSSEILAQAQKGVYDKLSISRGMSDKRLREYFDATADNRWAIKSAIKQRVRFRSLNLQDSYLTLGKFDIVFCRNVLIYFSYDLKADILKRIHGVLKPGGYLFLGSSESLGGASTLFEMVHCNPGVVYRAK
ncbi:CheR family methyltransferase [Agaribacterium haliotis]|uniref:CheR family methyltransferase n=1 Tax=Agaribacterium haliotis TaxID=2013869 RepID=UPI000BB58B54|nr:protein-glutamate O-methyltransferase CheR [Agaribacterium haliotis]